MGRSTDAAHDLHSIVLTLSGHLQEEIDLIKNVHCWTIDEINAWMKAWNSEWMIIQSDNQYFLSKEWLPYYIVALKVFPTRKELDLFLREQAAYLVIEVSLLTFVKGVGDASEDLSREQCQKDAEKA